MSGYIPPDLTDKVVAAAVDNPRAMCSSANPAEAAQARAGLALNEVFVRWLHAEVNRGTSVNAIATAVVSVTAWMVSTCASTGLSREASVADGERALKAGLMVRKLAEVVGEYATDTSVEKHQYGPRQ